MDLPNLNLPDVDRDLECQLCGAPHLQGMKSAHMEITRYDDSGPTPSYRQDGILFSVVTGPECTENIVNFADQVSPIQHDDWNLRVKQAEQCGLCRGEIRDRVRYAGLLLVMEDDQKHTEIDISYCESCVEVTAKFIKNIVVEKNG